MKKKRMGVTIVFLLYIPAFLTYTWITCIDNMGKKLYFVKNKGYKD